ncbi:hypothetical protein [Riemerella anatipestifer]|uniref:hypothetical protein n=1 Tax=Riemerella anatipestifer TaxID=34085 RepID=UPI00208FC03D|nr:hypothetical protein [Riemerella anatipestifer]MCO4303706.1 hypothetical protein [Riemerella anatipestifer]MCO7352111.1 hypothetical protein [Riemerella anatipestifer]MCT6760624.1 hypothetical protein [Riemerella anatipestifer]MCT6764304.1 hypothetical protein [Riemerella anatipestifer]MCT6766339.1 hypothetical protein [Riemerella anatipestifer]
MQEEQNYNAFQELNIFENPEINKVCDALFTKVKQLTNEDLSVCGSMAKVFDGTLPKDYQPKDLDLVISQWGFRLLTSNLEELEGVLMIEKLPSRVILYLKGLFQIEIWEKQYNFKEMNYISGVYRGQIKYSYYVKKI